MDSEQQSVDWAAFGTYLSEQHLAPSTQEQYMTEAIAFRKQFNPFENDPEAFAMNVNAFVGKNISALHAIRHLLGFIGREDFWKAYYRKHGRHVKPGKRKHTIKAISMSEITAFKDQLYKPFSTIAMVEFEGCLRINEVLQLRSRDCDMEQDHMKLSITAKGGESYSVTILNPDTIREMIEAKAKCSNENERIFRITTDTVNRQYHIAAAKAFGSARGKAFSSHWLRHSRAVMVWNQTKDVLKVMAVLRHKRMETTYQYLKSTGLLEADIMKEVPVQWGEQT